LMNE